MRARWMSVVVVLSTGCLVPVGEDDGGELTGGGTAASAGGSATAGGAATGGGSASAGGSATGGGSAGGAALPNFSFFVTSMVAMQQLSNSQNGFGGDLRFGETGAGAGLRGADKLCAAIAERSMPGSSVKQWRAFLSVSADANGQPVNAIDRIGNGPWYDRLGRLMANQKSELLAQRPAVADAAIRRDLPNEDGVPNNAPNGTIVDNHDTMTGSDTLGRLQAGGAPCANFTTTSTAGTVRPMAGHSWPRAGQTTNDGAHWISAHQVPGCAAGITITNSGGGMGSVTVGGAGGYGGIYCFALSP